MDEVLTNSPTILVVDDEELMREVVSIMIEENGGIAVEAVNGADAVEKFKAQASEIDCVVMDFSMPEMNGYQAFCEIRKLNSSVPVVLASGLQATPEVVELLQKGEVSFLNKPFHEEELMETLAAKLG